MLKTGPVELKRAYLRMFIQRVVVSPSEVRIWGPKAHLAKAARADLTHQRQKFSVSFGGGVP